MFSLYDTTTGEILHRNFGNNDNSAARKTHFEELTGRVLESIDHATPLTGDYHVDLSGTPAIVDGVDTDTASRRVTLNDHRETLRSIHASQVITPHTVEAVLLSIIAVFNERGELDDRP